MPIGVGDKTLAGLTVSICGFVSPKPTCLPTQSNPLGVAAHWPSLTKSIVPISKAAVEPPRINPSSNKGDTPQY